MVIHISSTGLNPGGKSLANRQRFLGEPSSGNCAAQRPRRTANIDDVLEKCQGMPAPQLPAQDRLAGRINTVHLKDRLGDIETNRRNRLQ